MNRSPAMPAILQIGSETHRELFCREFVETHDPYDPAAIEWPQLDEVALGRLRALPFWQEAITTERNVARKVQALAPLEPDPLIRKAIELQGYEEGRHSTLLRYMISHYRIALAEIREDALPRNIEFAFIRTGYGECFDSFFAFGLFRLVRETGFVPRPLLDRFEHIVQEEARHILFFVNWIAYRRSMRPLGARLADASRCALAMAMQIWARVQTARGVDTGDFMMKSSDTFHFDISPRTFLDVCLEENDRRLGRYDPRLLRPRLVPSIARMVRKLLR